MSGCRCEKVELQVEGQVVKGIVRVDPDCSRHGLPKDAGQWQPQSWPNGTGHLRRHALLVEKATGDRITAVEARRRMRVPEGAAAEWETYLHRFRLETPRETEARLLAEMTEKRVPVIPHHA